jgi:hypothetical protein
MTVRLPAQVRPNLVPRTANSGGPILWSERLQRKGRPNAASTVNGNCLPV